MSFFRKKRMLLLLFLLLALVLFYNSNWVGKMMYPIRYKQEIDAGAAKYGVDPLLIAAIIRVESNYKPDLVSKKGAVGIMQIMPDTAEWILGMEPMESYTLNDLGDPKPNILIGTKYVAVLKQHFQNNLVEVIAAYNAGQGNVSRWRENGKWDGTMEHLDQIPFWETRNYVDRVLYYYKKYQQYHIKKSIG